MDEKLFSARISEYRERVDGYLTGCLSPASRARYHKLIDSMRYSLTAGGKRLRPILTLEFCRVCGGDVQAALPVACGVEMLHTYSLIHDDLPVMDNDDLRRGKPSNHKVFGECTALLAGDALQALAFQTVLSAPLPPERTLRCAQILAYAAGHEGICGGQQLDLAWEGLALTADELHEIYLRKTSAFIRAACLMGAAAAGGTVAQEKAAADYADHFGYAFQLRDDMLDVIGDEKTFGKPIGSDREEGKTTSVDLFGLEGCREKIRESSRAAESALAGLKDAEFLLHLVRVSEERSE